MNGLNAYIRDEINTAYAMLDNVRKTRRELKSEAEKRVSHSREAQWLAVIHTLQGVQDFMKDNLLEN
jgi:hypothetical protein